MNFHRFTILTYNEGQQSYEKNDILINLNQVVSIKPIKMATEQRDVIDGYWIRLTNGKKYKAIQIPKLLLDFFDENLPDVRMSSDASPSFSYQ